MKSRYSARIAALTLASMLTLICPFSAFAASDDDVVYHVGGISENGYLIDDDDNTIDFDEAVTGPAADSDLRVPYGKTIYFPLLNDGTAGNYDALVRTLEQAEQALSKEQDKLPALQKAQDDAKRVLDAQEKEELDEAKLEADRARTIADLLDDLIDALRILAAWQAGTVHDSGNAEQIVTAKTDALADYDVDVVQNSHKLDALYNEYNDKAVAPSIDRTKLPGYQAFLTAQNALKTQQDAVSAAEKARDDAQNAVDQATGGQDGYPFVHESQAVRSIKIKTDWDEGKSDIDSLSITKKRYKNSSYPAPSDARKYAYFLAIEIKERSSTSTSTRDASGTVKLKKTSGSHRFDYDDVSVDVDFEIGFNPPEDSNTIPIDPALFLPDEDFDEDTDEEFDFEADDDSYYVANTKGQKKIVLGLNTDYDDEIGDRYDYANLSFWNGNGASFNRSGYLYLYADEDDYLYSIDKHGELTLLHPDYDRYEDCFVIRTRTLGRYVVSDRKLREAATTGDPEPDVTVIYDVGTGVNYNPTTGGFGAEDDEDWTTAPAASPVFDQVLIRDGMLAKPEQSPAKTAPGSSSESKGSSSDGHAEEISAAPTAALTETNPLAPAAPIAPEAKAPLGRNTVILLCVLAAELTIALTSLVCYFVFFGRKR